MKWFKNNFVLYCCVQLNIYFKESIAFDLFKWYKQVFAYIVREGLFIDNTIRTVLLIGKLLKYLK